MLSFVWILFVASCDGYAKRNSILVSSIPNCRLRVNSWIVTNVTCAVIDINCYREGFTGSSEEITSILERVQRETMTRRILSHCPAITIPPTIREFFNLQSASMVNSTIAAWPQNVSLTKTQTPYVHQITFVWTNMTTFPQHRVHHDIPAPLARLIDRSDLSAVLDELNGVWRAHEWPYFRLEYTDVTTLPPSFADIRCKRLSLVGSPIAVIPSGRLSHAALSSLKLSLTKVSTLPELPRGTDALVQILAVNSAISSLPDWFWG